MKNRFFHDAISKIIKKEERLTMKASKIIEESYSMTLLLKDLLAELKDFVLNFGFETEQQEIDFFKNIKPHILGNSFSTIRFIALRQLARYRMVNCYSSIFHPS